MSQTRLRDISPVQWKAGAAAWLGWMFDGVELHLYTLVATPFVAELLMADRTSPEVRDCGALIQAAFLIGWALGGAFFGRLGDRIGRSHALVLTILTYAICTGLSFFAQAWWHLLVFRFLAALGIGGEWAVGAALLSETWPRRWGPWLAAVLQSAVNVGVLLAMPAVWLSSYWPYRYVFLVGILPALVVVWIRRNVPEPPEWDTARRHAERAAPRARDLFQPALLRTTVLTILVCGLGLSAHWSFMYWFVQHLRNLPEIVEIGLADPGQVTRYCTLALVIVTVSSIAGNFLAGWIARYLGYRRTIAWLSLAYFLAMWGAYCVPRGHAELLWWYVPIGAFQGLFGLYTMYLPPLFPTLLRTTGAGLCYNIGRIAAGVSVVVLGILAPVDDYRYVLLSASYLFLPAAVLARFLPDGEGGRS